MRTHLPHIRYMLKTEIFPINNKNDVDEMIEYGTSFHNRIDGVILHSNNTPYFRSKLYKIKPLTMHTVDCLLELDETTHKYKLFVKGNPGIPVTKKQAVCSKGDPTYKINKNAKEFIKIHSYNVHNMLVFASIIIFSIL